MRNIFNHKRAAFIVLLLAIGVFVSIRCMNNDSSHKSQNNNTLAHKDDFKLFAGSATCMTCHKDIYEKHLKTAHFLTSTPAFEKYIKGSFEPGKNTFAFNEFVKVVMEKRDSGLFQVEYVRGVEKRAKRFDMSIGSGTMGQSFLYWMHDQLFQMPITYFTAANTWSNSPGFPNNVYFNRPITSRCLECHSTYAKTISLGGEEPEKFDRQQMILGVDCEKCHGPALEHVTFQSQHPAEKTAKYIINPAKLTRVQSLELCALCHGGRMQKTKASFEFTAGDKLSDFFLVDTMPPDPQNIDVHANQYGLLRASKCFRMTTTLTCNTCHNTHENERGKISVFSQRCMTCHNQEHGTFCKIDSLPIATIKKNCIDCHMPLKSSRNIAVMLPGATTVTAALIRSHYISVYPDETKKVLEYMKK
jgi:hypothetical protein